MFTHIFIILKNVCLIRQIMDLANMYLTGFAFATDVFRFHYKQGSHGTLFANIVFRRKAVHILQNN